MKKKKKSKKLKSAFDIAMEKLGSYDEVYSLKGPGAQLPSVHYTDPSAIGKKTEFGPIGDGQASAPAHHMSFLDFVKSHFGIPSHMIDPEAVKFTDCFTNVKCVPSYAPFIEYGYKPKKPSMHELRRVVLWQHQRLGAPIDAGDPADMSGVEEMAKAMQDGHCVAVHRVEKDQKTVLESTILRKKK